MEQHLYRGTVSAEGMADYLVQQFDPRHNLQAQKLGQGEAFIVQVARGDDPSKQRNAVSVAIARSTDSEQGLLVSMGEQEWITPELAGHGLFMAVLSLLTTPWVLVGVLHQVSDALAGRGLPDQLWQAIDMYAASQGATKAS